MATYELALNRELRKGIIIKMNSSKIAKIMKDQNEKIRIDIESRIGYQKEVVCSVSNESTLGYITIIKGNNKNYQNN